MKKIIPIFLTVFVLCGLFSFSAFAADFPTDITLNGAAFGRYIMLADYTVVDFETHFDNVGHIANLLIVSPSGDFDSATLYQFSPNVGVKNGWVETIVSTSVAVFTSERDDNGDMYWKYSANATWSAGQRVAPYGNIWWTAKDIEAQDSLSVTIKGDKNFMTPLWAEIMMGVTQGETIILQQRTIQTLVCLTVCGIGLMVFSVILLLLRTKSLLFLKK